MYRRCCESIRAHRRGTEASHGIVLRVRTCAVHASPADAQGPKENTSIQEADTCNMHVPGCAHLPPVPMLPWLVLRPWSTPAWTLERLHCTLRSEVEGNRLHIFYGPVDCTQYHMVSTSGGSQPGRGSLTCCGDLNAIHLHRRWPRRGPLTLDALLRMSLRCLMLQVLGCLG